MFPFQFSLYFQVVFGKTNLEEKSLKRPLIRVFFLTFYPAWVFKTYLYLMLDRVFFRGYQKYQIHRPVFIVGNPRSGTTYLHRLLATNEARFLAPKLWQILMPSAFQLHTVNAISKVDSRIGSPLRRFIQRVEPIFFKRTEKIHKMSMMKAEEDEAYFVHVFAAVFLAIAFPNNAIRALAAFDDLEDEKRHTLMGFYKECIQKLMHTLGGDRRLLSKNPSFTGKMLTLSENFPDGHLVYIVRHPTQSLCSLQSMFMRLFEAQGMAPKAGQSRRRDPLINLMCHYYEHAIKVLDDMDESRYTIVKYDDLIADPVATVERIYRDIGEEISPAYRSELEAIRAQNRNRKSKHDYSLAEFDVTHEEVERRLGFLYDRFGFERLSQQEAA